MQIAIERQTMFDAAKYQKSQEIVELLELFSGQLTLTDLLETPLPIIDSLQRAKVQQLQKKNPAPSIQNMVTNLK